MEHSLFDLAMPWWEFVLRAVAVYVVVLLMVRVTGRRASGQSTPFDTLVIVLLGTAETCPSQTPGVGSGAGNCRV